MTPVSQLPIVVVPGIQGHWQWMRPTIAALRATPGLAGHNPDDEDGEGVVRTFSLGEEDGSGDPFEQWMARIDRLLDEAQSERAVVIGVSFGGLVATRYAARRPDRVGALVLVSAPSPRRALTPTDLRFLKSPIAAIPFFALRGLRRLLPEIVAAHSSWWSRVRFLVAYCRQILVRPIAPRRMARWVRAWQATDITSDCARVTVPTRVITGEPGLDRVVPVSSTLDYVTLIPGTTAAILNRTGHIGVVSRPHDFSALVREFLNAVDDSRSRRSA